MQRTFEYVRLEREMVQAVVFFQKEIRVNMIIRESLL